MKKIILITLSAIILISCFSACAATPLSTQTFTPTATSDLPEQFQQSSPNLEDNWLILNIIECDFDGDGTQEIVILQCDPNEFETVYAKITGSVNVLETLSLPSFAGLNQVISIDLDGDGGDRLLIAADTGATGGWGHQNLTGLTFDEGRIRQFHAGGPYGFTATGKLLPMFEAEITVAETDRVFTFPLSDTTYLRYEGYYSEDGELLLDTDMYMDGICYVAVKPEDGVVEIGQFLWTVTHINGEEFLVTELTFGKDGFTVASQRVETYEYVQEYVGRG